MRAITALSAAFAATLSLTCFPDIAHADVKPTPPRPLSIAPRHSLVSLASLPQRFFTAHRGDGSFLAPENT